MKTPLVGGSGVYRSHNLSYNRLINLYPEFVLTKDGMAPGALYSCPGLTQIGTVGAGPVRKTFVANNGLLYVVSGNNFYEVSNTYAATLLGQIGSFSGAVSIIDNGTQLLVVDGVGGWVWNYVTRTYSQVLPGTLGITPGLAVFQDGFGIVTAVGTNQFYQSNLNDFTTWNGLNFSSADSTPDPLISIGEIHRELWLFKQRTTEVWINAGLNGFVFQRVQGVQIQAGCIAPASVARLGESLVWLGQDEQGQGTVWLARGYVAAPISDPGVSEAMEQIVANGGTLADARAFVYQQGGHIFYVLNFYSGNQTWVYDLTTQLWHQRSFFNNGQFTIYRAACHAYFNQNHVVGDYLTGALYKLDLTTFTDAGALRKWLRTWRALPPNQSKPTPLTFNRLQITLQTGVGIPSGINPQFMLRWSDDGGFTWSSEVWTDSNLVGNTQSYITFRRLGSTRYATGLDRLFELSGTDPVPIFLTAADLEVEAA